MPLDGEKLTAPALSLADHVILVLELESSVRVTLQEYVVGPPLQLELVLSRLVGLTDHVAVGVGVGDGGVGVGDGGGGGVGDGGSVGVGDGVGDGDGDGVGVVPGTATVTAACTFPPFEVMVRKAA
jgi:hypothetical protein